MTSKNDSTRKRQKGDPNRGPIAVIAILAAGFLLILGSGWIFASSRDRPPSGYIPDVAGKPSLKVDKERIDFGDVKFNTVVTATFQLANVGDETLQLVEAPYIEVIEGC
jgi:hypothetical protein